MNSAHRLLRVFQPAAQLPDNTNVLSAWCKVFGIEEGSTTKTSLRVAESLNGLHDELVVMDHQLSTTQLSKPLYERATVSIDAALSVMLLGGNWGQIKQYLTGETLLSLGFCAEILPNEEEDISPETLAELHALLGELRDVAESDGVNERLRELIRHHLSLLEKALFDYKIRGISSLRTAVHTATGELIESQDILKEERGSPQVGKLAKVWNKVIDVITKAEKVDKGIQLIHKAWALIESLLP